MKYHTLNHETLEIQFDYSLGYNEKGFCRNFSNPIAEFMSHLELEHHRRPESTG